MYKQLIIDTCKRYKLNFEEAAYVLATADWETNHTFEPVREAYYLGSKAEAHRKKLKYYPYYGRGFVQLTWKDNYKKVSDYFGFDYVSNPDGVMEPAIAAKILVVGMKEGWFTGKDLDDYIDGVDESDKEDFLEYYDSRRLINGMDKANEIAQLAEKYEKELKESGYGLTVSQSPPVKEEAPTEGVGSLNGFGLLVSLLLAILKRFVKGK